MWQGSVDRRESSCHGTHYVFVDVLNIVSCFAVVCLHTSLGVFSLQHTFLWTFQELMQAMFIFAVPIFFMVSGMNLLDYRKKYSTKVFFKKRFVRVGRALILGSIACYLLFGLLPGLFYGAQSIADGFGPVDFCKRFLTNSIIDIYWFLYTIIYLYLLTPLLSKIVHDRRLLEYAIALTLFCSILIPAAKAIGINEEYFSPLLSWPLFASSAAVFPAGILFGKLRLAVALECACMGRNFPRFCDVDVPRRFMLERFLPEFDGGGIPELSCRHFLSVMCDIRGITVHALQSAGAIPSAWI